MLGPKGPFCQSCGMPLSRDPLGGGTNQDGSRNSEYCGHCYRDGRFTEPNLTADQMVEKVEGKLRQMHFPRFLARRFTKNIPSLGRWRAAGTGRAT
jgi:putative zinc ribbon protein